MATTADARAARERKQKIFVAIGGLLLLGLLAIQLPKMLGGSEPSASPGQETTTVSGETTPGDESTLGASGGEPPRAISVALVDTDRPLPLGPGQLSSFSAFTSKDPFVQQVTEPAPLPTPSPAPKAQKPRVATPAKDFSSKRKPSGAAVTVISVNGVRHALDPGATFPPADPVFVLVSVQPGAKTAVVGVPGGKYENGSRTTRLQVGKPQLLVNTTTKSRYRILLVKVGKPAAGTKR